MAGDSFWSNIFHPERTSQDLVSLLGSISIFADLREREIRQLSHIVHRRVYERDEVIFREGEIGAGM